jgi:SAM-dependent methyltransferase
MNTPKASTIELCLCPPPGAEAVPRFDAGWLTDGGMRQAFLSYVTADAEDAVNWSERLEELHEQSGRVHFLDVWTRRAMLARLGPLAPEPTVIDIGCSAGYLLEDLAGSVPRGTLIGVDLIASGLRRASRIVPQALLLQADVCALPLADASTDAVVSANVLEHVPDDERALAEIFRILRPGARAVIVVPLGSGIYDYYDRLLGHERRYARGELAGKARGVGLEVLEDVALGALLYPAFWLVKQRNRRRYGQLRGEALERRVVGDFEGTRDSAVGRLCCWVEEALLRGGVRLPFGIRGLTVLRRPEVRARGAPG